jgi:cell division septal protein FtsQ
MKLSSSPKSIKKLYQGKTSQIFLNRLLRRRRGVRNPRTMIRKYSKSGSIVALLALLVAAIYFSYTYLDRRELLDIEGFEIVGATKFVNMNDVASLVKTNIEGKKISNFNPGILETLLKSNFLGAKNISVQRKSLNNIKVIIEERVPLAVLFSLPDNRKYLIDVDGYVLGEVEDSFNELPTVQYNRAVLVNTFVEKDIVPLTVELLNLLEKEELKASSISFHPKYMKLYVESGTEVLIGNYKNYEKFMEVVSSLIKKSNLEGKNVSRIDLRYDKVIVSYD